MSKKENDSKNATADDLFGKMVGEYLKALPPISKLQARNEIQIPHSNNAGFLVHQW